ncbi:MAG: molybdopterin-dependent oxidoreductase [Syntrophomonas sp.]
MSEFRKAICGVCPGGCAILAEVRNGTLVGVSSRENDPFGNLCIRGKAAPEIVYSPDRLKKPLIRAGARGEGSFRETSWDEALDYVVDKMKEIKQNYGPQAIASHSGRGAFEHSMEDFYNSSADMVSLRLTSSFGSPSAASDGSLCYVSYGLLAPITTYGIPATGLLPDFENSNLIVVWGANPVTDSPPFMFKRIVQAQKNGKKIIAIDHMKSDIARRADRWIGLRSGTDGALALGLINVVITEELYDKEFVKNWTVGFEELSKYVKRFTPEEVERITWVPKEQVVSLAREIAASHPVTLRTYTGLEYSNSGVQNIRAVLILWALTGNLDVPGGLTIGLPPQKPMEQEDILCSKIKPFGAEKYSLFYELTGSAHFMEFPRAVLEGEPYPVKGLIINGASTLTSYPQPEIFEQAYRNLDLMVVIDLFLTKDALFADVVLPSATYFEINSYQRYPGGYMRLRRKVIEPVGEAKNQVLIMGELAKRLGLGHLYPQTEEEILTKAFSKKPELLARLKESEDGLKIPQQPFVPRKYERGLLRTDGNVGFPTPSGKVELLSALLEKHGYEGLPIYVDPIEGPTGDVSIYKEYPLILNTGARIQSTFRSQHLNIPSLVKIQDKPQVLINPIDADDRDIKSGDKVLVRTKRGQVQFWAQVSEKVLPGAVEVNQGGGTPIQVQEWQHSNVNYLTDFNNRDPISGFPVFKALLCQIEKIQPPPQ